MRRKLTLSNLYSVGGATTTTISQQSFLYYSTTKAPKSPSISDTMDAKTVPTEEKEETKKENFDATATFLEVCLRPIFICTRVSKYSTLIFDCHFLQTFSNADALDYACMFVGTLGGMVTGVSLPIFNVLFGKILNALNSNPGGFSKSIDALCIDFAVIAGINIFSGFLQV